MRIAYQDLLIRDADVRDAVQLCTWWNDGQVMAHAGFPNGLGTSVDRVRKQIEEQSTGFSTNNRRHMILYKGVPIGEMNYCPVDEGVCEIGIKICDASMQNKGMGRVILSMFLHGLFAECGFQKIILDTNLNNKRAQHVYEQLGFRKTGVRKDSWKDQLGQLQSAVDYELTEETFMSFAD